MKRKVKLLCGLSLFMALGAGLALLVPSVNPAMRGIANGDCNWNHYEKVEETSYTSGCKEYWVCCQHHEIVFEAPVAGTINEATHPEGFVEALETSDKRFIPAKANVISDASKVDYVAHDYQLATSTFTKKVDPVIGNYVECSNLTNTGDAVWIAPSNLPNENLLKTFEKIYFWVRSTNNQNLEIRDFSYAAKEYSSLEANEWKYFEVDVANIANNGVGVSHWAAHATAINFDISSFYGVRDNAVMLMDTGVNVFRGTDSSASDYQANAGQGGNATYTANCTDNSMISPYAKAEGINRSGDQLNLSPELKMDISIYTVVFFYVRINGGTTTTSINLRSGIYDSITTVCAANSTDWNLVVITPSATGNFKDLQYYGIGNWGTFTGLELDFSSIFAYAPEYDVLYNAKTDYWVDYDAVADANRLVNQKGAVVVKEYSRITGITRTDGQEKFRPAATTNLSEYKAIFFWVRSNVELTNMKVLNENDAYTETSPVVTISSMLANTWVQVYFAKSLLAEAAMNKIVFGKWGTFDNVTLDFSSVYGVK